MHPAVVMAQLRHDQPQLVLEPLRHWGAMAPRGPTWEFCQRSRLQERSE